MIQCDNEMYNMPMTLEQHFELLVGRYPNVRELYSLWQLMRNKIEQEITHSLGVFVNYSKHDGSHSRAIIQSIERFLGEERIEKLSATDTFMLLICAYAHDYGMALSFNKIYEVLGSKDFNKFIEKMSSKLSVLEKEYAWSIKNILIFLQKKKHEISLQDMYLSIMLVVQIYLRPNHWKGVVDIQKDFNELFQNYIKGRFIAGSEGIIDICMCHGKDFNSIFELSLRADGIIGDEFHPRFVAAMIRLGDLLDLDNGRFPAWFVKEASQKNNIIPKISILHYQKHESISHLLITHKKIEIVAQCYKERGGAEVANLISEWTGWLIDECKEMVLHWGKITQPDFGRPPENVQVNIYIDGKKYISENKKLQMQMSQERVMDLLEGTSIYKDRYVGIREMIQNAVDASLLQLWKDIIQNRYLPYDLSKNMINSGLDMMDLLKNNRDAIFKNYDINIEVVCDKMEEKVYLIIKDKGIGVTEGDVTYIANIGSSKEKNMRIKEIMRNMPEWLKPSGVFGIGLQSVFQLTDCIQIYTRQHNEPERLIELYSYGKNKGKINIIELPTSEEDTYYDNGIPGTNIKISIEAKKLFGEKTTSKSTNHFLYYDTEFDIREEIDIVYAEICRACEERIKEVKYDYFNIYFQTMLIDEGGNLKKDRKRRLRKSYFSLPDKNEKRAFGDGLSTWKMANNQPYAFINNMAVFWDSKEMRLYKIKVRPCTIRAGKVFFPKGLPDLYSINYKFSTITDISTLYSNERIANRLYAGFFSLDVIIMDDKPTKYLNIDRDRLRDESIDEEELIKVQKQIIQRWCTYFIDAEIRWRYSSEILISLIFTFYQNVSKENFKKFINLYRKDIENLDFKLYTDNLFVRDLWNIENKYYTQFDLGNYFRDISCNYKKKDEKLIYVKDIQLLPYRLIKVNSINVIKNKLVYQFQLGMQIEENGAVEMDNMARLYDYVNAFDNLNLQSNKIDFLSIQKKVFKPDNAYRYLIVPVYPHTFRKGDNFSLALDYSIHWYILSPFDKTTAMMLKRHLESKEVTLEELQNAIMDSRQMEKCVQYIIRKREKVYDFKGIKEMEEMIKRDYANFIKMFLELIASYRISIE